MQCQELDWWHCAIRISLNVKPSRQLFGSSAPLSVKVLNREEPNHRFQGMMIRRLYEDDLCTAKEAKWPKDSQLGTFQKEKAKQSRHNMCLHIASPYLHRTLEGQTRPPPHTLTQSAIFSTDTPRQGFQIFRLSWQALAARPYRVSTTSEQSQLA